MDYATMLGETVTVLFIIMCYTYLIKENVLFKFVQATYVGLGIGHGLVMVVGYLTSTTFPAIAAGNISLILPVAMGLLLFGRLKRQYLWVYRYPLALLVGTGLGLQIMGMLKASLIDQMISTMSVTLTPNLAGFNSVIIVFFVIASMTYFLFTIRGKETARSAMNPLLSAMMNVGQYVLMGAIGAGFAASFLGRLAVFMDVLERVVYFIPRMLGLM
jgi:hypothetical protein